MNEHYSYLYELIHGFKFYLIHTVFEILHETLKSYSTNKNILRENVDQTFIKICERVIVQKCSSLSNLLHRTK